MVIWIKRIARILSFITFFFVFIIGIDPAQPFDPMMLTVAFVKAFLGAVLFWFGGFVLADIVLKGLVSTIPTTEDDSIDGGLIQRIHEEKVKIISENVAPPPVDKALKKNNKVQ